MVIFAYGLFFLSMLLLGNEFAKHSWRTIPRFWCLAWVVLSVGFVWWQTQALPSLWAVVCGMLLVVLTFFLVRVLFFKAWHILGIDTRVSSGIDDLHYRARIGKIKIEDAIAGLKDFQNRTQDPRLLNFIAFVRVDLVLELRKVVAMGSIKPHAALALMDYFQRSAEDTKLLSVLETVRKNLVRGGEQSRCQENSSTEPRED